MTSDLLANAMAARMNDDIQTAVSICRDILSSNPNDYHAKSFLGVCLIELGRISEARPLIENALSEAPNHWRLLLNLSELNEAEGDLEKARESAESAALASPERYEVWGRLGDLSGRLGDFDNARRALEKALSINNAHPGLQLRYAAACYEIGDYDNAENALQHFEKAASGHPEALRLRTFLARKKNDWPALIQAASAWLEAAPYDATPRVALAFGYAQEGRFVRAVDIYRPLTEKTDTTAEHLSVLGNYLLSARKVNEAESCLRRALTNNPAQSDAASALGRLMSFRGEREKALYYSRQAIDGDPGNVDAYAQLATDDPLTLTKEERARLQRLGEDESLLIEQRARCWFALGDIYHHEKKSDAAFHAWDRACELKRALGATDPAAQYDHKAHTEKISTLIELFDGTAQRRTFEKSVTPVFIVGMPRSGTTLLESALSAHESVSAAGELPALPHLLNEFLTWARHENWRGGELPDSVIETTRKRYIAQYADYNVEQAPFIIDKQPINFLCVGLIRRIFPHAKIIYIRRNPVETGFSIFRRNFTRLWPFANSMEDIAHYYAEHARLCSHWLKSFEGEMAFVQYETLVEDFENQLRDLLSYCSLEWDSQCLEYYKQDRTVITFSTTQVRKPPSSEHLHATASYERHLAPMRSALTGAGVNLETGALNATPQT